MFTLCSSAQAMTQYPMPAVRVLLAIGILFGKRAEPTRKHVGCPLHNHEVTNFGVFLARNKAELPAN